MEGGGEGGGEGVEEEGVVNLAKNVSGNESMENEDVSGCFISRMCPNDVQTISIDRPTTA